MKTFFLFLFCLFTLFSFSQTAPAIEWQNSIGGSGRDYASIIVQTSDGGYFITGTSESGISGDKTAASLDYDVWVMKLNSAGSITWQKTLGGNDFDGTGIENDLMGDGMQTADGGYIVAITAYSGISGNKTSANFGNADWWVVKLTSAGDIDWQKAFGGSEYDEIKTVAQTADGGYIFGGSSYSLVSGNKTAGNFGQSDYWVIKTDAAGNIEWQKTLNGDMYDRLTDLKQSADHGYILAGYSQSNITADKSEGPVGGLVGPGGGYIDDWIVKIDSAGNVEWDNTIGGTNQDWTSSVDVTSDGGYLITGYSVSDASGDKSENAIGLGGQDFWVIRLNSTGSIVWENTIGGADGDFGYSGMQTADGGYIIGGPSFSDAGFDKSDPNPTADNDYWLVKLNSAGTVVWDKSFRGSKEDILKSVIQTSDGGYAMAGFSSSNISGDKTENAVSNSKDIWVIKLFAEEIPICTTAPDGLFADHITTTKSKLHWDADADAIKYKVQYKPNTSPVWTTINSTGNVKTLTGLTPNTLYKYRVRSTCSDVVSSPWSGIQTFTTLPLRESVCDQQMEVNIYPNPNTGNFTILFPEINNEAIVISIKNMLGEEIYAEQINVSALNHTVSLGKNISAGMYFCEIQTKNKIFTQQIIVTN